MRFRTHGHGLRRLIVAGAILGLTASCRGRDIDSANELPFGAIDVPAAGTVLRPGPTVVGGWALDDSGIAEVRIYFDGRFVERATPNVPRPDVAQAYPKYARGGDRHGWNLEVDFAATPGAHTILAQAVDSQGATRDLGSVAVTAPQ